MREECRCPKCSGIMSYNPLRNTYVCRCRVEMDARDVEKQIKNENEFAVISMLCSKGNPGAMAAMLDIYENRHGGLDYIVELGIYGSELYMLWNDSCHRDVNKFYDLLVKFKERKLTQEQLKEAVTDKSRGDSYDKLISLANNKIKTNL